MPDMTMCDNKSCAIKNHCYRFTAHPSFLQHYDTFQFISDTECSYFIDNTGKKNVEK